MSRSSQIIGEMLPEIHTNGKVYFLTPEIHFQIIYFSVISVYIDWIHISYTLSDFLCGYSGNAWILQFLRNVHYKNASVDNKS